MSANASTDNQASSAAAPRRSIAPRRHGGQRHQLGLSGSNADRVLLDEARSMLAEGLCDAPIQQITSSLKCSSNRSTPNWSPASTASTDAPPMAPLELPVAAVDLEWPAVHEAQREAERGWDFCSHASDDTSSWVQELDMHLAPDPEVPSGTMDDSVAWLVTSGAAPEPSEDAVPKRTFVQALLASRQGTGAAAVAAGCRMPAVTGPSGQDVKQSRVPGAADDPEDDAAECFSPRAISHGWKKQHKAPRNSRQLRKLGQQTQRRAEQSFRTRGWLDEQQQEDEA